MDKDHLQGETSTVRTTDRGEVSGKPVGAAEDGDDPATEQLLAQNEIEAEEYDEAHED
jgi:hypothetical protein